MAAQRCGLLRQCRKAAGTAAIKNGQVLNDHNHNLQTRVKAIVTGMKINTATGLKALTSEPAQTTPKAHPHWGATE